MVAQPKRTIQVRAIIPADRRVMVQLPADMPMGEVQVTIEALEEDEQPVSTQPTREAARHTLLAAGKLGTAHLPPGDLVRPSDEDIRSAGSLPPDALPSEHLIRQDRDDSE